MSSYSSNISVVSPSYCLCSFAKGQLTVFVGVYFWTLFCCIDVFVWLVLMLIWLVLVLVWLVLMLVWLVLMLVWLLLMLIWLVLMVWLVLKFVWGFFIYALYQIEGISFCSLFVDCLYYVKMLDFWPMLFLHIFWSSYGFCSLLCGYVRLIDFEILNQTCIPGINLTWPWCIILFCKLLDLVC